MLCFLASWRIPRSLFLYLCLFEFFFFHRRPSFLDTKRPRPAPVLLILFEQPFSFLLSCLLVLGKNVRDFLPLLHVYIYQALLLPKIPLLGWR
jgi:hypothetical protein